MTSHEATTPKQSAHEDDGSSELEELEKDDTVSMAFAIFACGIFFILCLISVVFLYKAKKYIGVAVGIVLCCVFALAIAGASYAIAHPF